MRKRFLCLWLPHFKTDNAIRRNPVLAKTPFAICIADHGALRVLAVNQIANQGGIIPGMSLADAQSLLPGLQKIEDPSAADQATLTKMADWCMRYTPIVSFCGSDGLWLDITGCAHLRGGENGLIQDLVQRFRQLSYHIRCAIADTTGTAWAMAHYGPSPYVVVSVGTNRTNIADLPPAALRLEDETVFNLTRLGIRSISQLMTIPRPALARRFGQRLLLRLDQALGDQEEKTIPHHPTVTDQVRLHFPDPIVTAEGITAVLRRLLDMLCIQLEAKETGVRHAILYGFRVDNQIVQIAIGTGSPARSPKHLLRLFAEKSETIDPGLGIETFVLSAPHVEPLAPQQSHMSGGLGEADHSRVAELVDILRNRLGPARVYRYLPVASHWPERSVKKTGSLTEEPTTGWTNRPRPPLLLPRPEPIQVMAPVPDYPPVQFRYRGVLRRISRADGPERIENEWWIENNEARDYFRIEDQDGRRYWVFRAGPYRHQEASRWFLHGFFA